jgi:hypothetical protein
MRLAWFTPWPPDRHPAARRSRDIVRALAARGDDIELVVADEAVFGADYAVAGAPGGRMVTATDSRTHGAGPDLAVYAVVNDAACAFMWPTLMEQPGLTLLHDTNIHALWRAAAPGGAAAYRTEFARSHPDVHPDGAELAIAGFEGAYESFWPMLRSVVAASRVLTVPTAAAARDLQSRWPGASIAIVTPGIEAPAPSNADTRRARRSALNLPDQAVVFGVVGEGDGSVARRRLPPILRAFAGTLGRVPHVRLLIAGMETDLALQPPAVRDAIARVGPVTEEERRHLMDVVDVLVDLHWPPAAGPSDQWLAGMAAGRPAIGMDTAATADVPLLDPRSWRPPVDGRDPVGVAIDILDEDHSLRLACYRLAVDHALRERLGRAAHTYWEQTHTLSHMTAGVVRAIDLALARPANRPAPFPQLHQPEDSVMQEPTC